jgi:hypothetical protein
MSARSLQKGHSSSSTYLQFSNVGGSIGAERYEAEIVDGAVVLRFTLKPVDENQRLDEDELHTQPLVSVQIMDALVIRNLKQFCAARAKGIQGRKLEIISRGKAMQFDIVRAIRHSDSFLELEVQNLARSVST